MTAVDMNRERGGASEECATSVKHFRAYPHKEGGAINGSLKGTMPLLQPTSNAVELCRNYEYVMYVLSVKFKR